jgi:hypothetical protein
MPTCSKSRPDSTGDVWRNREICNGISRTDERLLSFLRVDPGGAEHAGVEAMSGADWEVLLYTATLHGATPLLYHRLTTCHTDTPIPMDVLLELRRGYLQNSGRNMHLYHELGKVLESFEQADIPVITLKGAHLAEVVYGNIALRPMNDVDLLVRKEDLERVEKSLLKIGYIPAECERRVATGNHHFVYSLPDKKMTVEIHWNLIPSTDPFRIDMDGQWSRSRTAIFGKIEVSVLCPEDLLLYLCLHASKHQFDIWLKPFCDISATIWLYGEEIDWNQVRICSGQAGINNGVYLALRLARELLGTPVPETFLDAIKPDDFDERFIVMAKGRIFATGQRSSDGLSMVQNLAQLFGSKRFVNKVALFLKRVFLPREEMARMYPAPSDSLRIYFYYPARIRDLLLRHGRQVWRLMRRDEGMGGLVKLENEINPLRNWLMSKG